MTCSTTLLEDPKPVVSAPVADAPALILTFESVVALSRKAPKPLGNIGSRPLTVITGIGSPGDSLDVPGIGLDDAIGRVPVSPFKSPAVSE